MTSSSAYSTDHRPEVGDTLDCGDVLTSEEQHRHGTHSTGVPMFTGYDRTTDGRFICYRHADEEQRAAFLVAGMTGEPFTAYVSADGDLTTWTGGILATRMTWHHGVSRSGWNGSEVHSWRFAVGSIGDRVEWYGRNAGPGMAITVRRAKHNA